MSEASHFHGPTHGHNVIAGVHSAAGGTINFNFFSGTSARNGNLVNQLPYADEAPFNSYAKQHEPTCLPDTRVDVLRGIHEWADRQDERRIFWLNGLAGTGKSTIARTVARKYSERKRLGASFFFSRGRGDVSHAGKFVASIAVQLAHNVPGLHQQICDAITEHSDIASQSLRDQWHQLVLRPLSKQDNNGCQTSYVLVVDALDECDDDNNIRIIIQLLAEARSSGTVQLRVFLTSRPEIPIRNGFYQIPNEYQNFVLHSISPSIVDHDISIFLEYNLRLIGQEDSLDAGWPGAEAIRTLVQSANGLFIWAATACRFIREGLFADERLCRLLEGGAAASTPEDHLNGIYITVLQNSIQPGYTKQEKESFYSMLRDILGIIVALFSPLSVESLSRLLLITKQRVDRMLKGLHAILDIPKGQTCPVRLHHPSFRDFLLEKDRCHNQWFWVDEKQAHRTLAERCIQLMSASLKQDICGQDAPSVLVTSIETSRVQNCLPPDLQYACVYWIQHLQKSDIPLRDNGQVHQFLKAHLLHWLEALCWMRKVSEGIPAIASLESIAVISDCPNLYAFIHDIKRFVLFSRSTLEQAPLQIYSSALVFAPVMSIVRKQFIHKVPRWIKRLPRVEQNWNALLQTLEGHSRWVNAVAFSPDGKVLVSASDNGTVKLWDAGTGAVLQTIEGHLDTVMAVAFSPDGKVLASASYDKTVRLWDAGTGTVLQTLKGHLDRVMAVAFSPDGKVLASASYDKTVRLWDVGKGATLQTLEGHLDAVTVIIFSPDGKQLASASYDKTVRLWDAATGAALHILEGPSDMIYAIAFSLDGKQLAVVLHGKMVGLWDWVTEAGTVTAFSPDDRQLGSALYKKVVRLFNTPTLAAMQRLQSHSDGFTAIAFSPDGKQLASASYDKTVQLWDVATRAALQTLRGHSGAVTAIVFSPDGKQLASASYDKTVRLWDAATETAPLTLKRHLHRVAAVFSPDAKQLASASHDRAVRIWDAATETAPLTLKRHLHRVAAVVFSPDAKQLASASHDRTVRIWDAATGMVLQTLEGHSNTVTAIVFSPDGKQLASTSSDKTVRLWDAATGVALQTLKRHIDIVNAIAFSPDGKQLASGSEDNTVRLWNTVTGAALRTLKGHLNAVTAIAFSPDGKQLASASSSSYDGMVQLCDVATGVALQKLGARSGTVTAVVFSPDGKQLASALSDETVRLWDAATGAPLRTFEVYAIIRTLSFSSDSTCLETDRGSLDLNFVSPGTVPSRRTISRGIFVEEQWIARGIDGLLWLPLDYRPSCMAVRENIVVLGHASGHVSILEFTL